MIEGLALHLRGALDGDGAKFLQLRVEAIGVLLAVAILLVEPAQAVDEERRLELGEAVVAPEDLAELLELHAPDARHALGEVAAAVAAEACSMRLKRRGSPVIAQPPSPDVITLPWCMLKQPMYGAGVLAVPAGAVALREGARLPGDSSPWRERGRSSMWTMEP